MAASRTSRFAEYSKNLTYCNPRLSTYMGRRQSSSDDPVTLVVVDSKGEPRGVVTLDALAQLAE